MNTFSFSFAKSAVNSCFLSVLAAAAVTRLINSRIKSNFHTIEQQMKSQSILCTSFVKSSIHPSIVVEVTATAASPTRQLPGSLPSLRSPVVVNRASAQRSEAATLTAEWAHKTAFVHHSAAYRTGGMCSEVLTIFFSVFALQVYEMGCCVAS